MDIRPLMEDGEEERSLLGNEECSIDDVGGEDNYEENMDDEDELNSERSPFLEAVNDTTAVQIKRRIGLVHAIAIVVGGIIGSGIFISPRYVVLHAGSMGETLLIWTFGGVLSLLGGLCYCELGTFIEKSGGDYIYLKLAYGRFIGFLYS